MNSENFEKPESRMKEEPVLPAAQKEPRLIHSDPDFLIFYKPEDLSFYEDGKKHDLLKAIRRMEEEGRIPEGERLFPVHRLDRITSGLLLFARGRNNANLLGNEFRHNRIHKVYLALSLHPPKKRHGFIEGDIVKSRRGTYKLAHTMEFPSRTRFTSRSIPDRRPGMRLFLVKPETGKTHQVRVVLKSLGSPILGDPFYDRFDAARAEDRTYLHALALSFRLGNKEHRFFHLPESGAEYLTPQFSQTLASFGDVFQIKWPGKETVTVDASARKAEARHTGFPARGKSTGRQDATERSTGNRKSRPGRRERRSRNH
jgi:tRNA pseudouridine32 synthase/23S rRNA pseudouridine746 synthase